MPASKDPKTEYTKQGRYVDPSNGDMWERDSQAHWRWINGTSWRFIPAGLERVGNAFGFTDAD